MLKADNVCSDDNNNNSSKTSNNNSGSNSSLSVMAALSDLDTLLGDLEKTCQQQVRQVREQEAVKVTATSQQDHPANENDESRSHVVTLQHQNGNNDSNNKSNGQSELDEMLKELTAAR